MLSQPHVASPHTPITTLSLSATRLEHVPRVQKVLNASDDVIPAALTDGEGADPPLQPLGALIVPVGDEGGGADDQGPWG